MIVCVLYILSKLNTLNVTLRSHLPMLSQRRLDMKADFVNGNILAESVAYEERDATMALLDDALLHLQKYNTVVKFLGFDLSPLVYKATVGVLTLMATALVGLFYTRVEGSDFGIG